MQDQKSSSSIFSFKKSHRRFLKQSLVFFIPVVLLYIIIELLVLQIPFNYDATSSFFNSEKEQIEIMALGPSQTNSAINPKYFEITTISLASTSQHHNLDFKILKQTKDRLPNLKYLVLELSYSHLELPHNSKDFWKNSVYLKYYNINAFERNTYFKDKLIFLARPDIYSKHLVNHYIKKKPGPTLNNFGFNENVSEGLFYNLEYNDSLITSKKFRINTEPNLTLFKYNTEFLFEMLDYTKKHNLNVVISTIPLYKTYLKARNPKILKRRDSILGVISEKYSNVRIFYKESDTIRFTTSDYVNQNHLNPRGAEKFSIELNEFIQKEFKN